MTNLKNLPLKANLRVGFLFKLTGIKKLLFFFFFLVLNSFSQNQLPLENGFLEDVEEDLFQNWTYISNNGADVEFSIVSDDIVLGSTKALSAQVNALGSNGWHASTKSGNFHVTGGLEYTVTFYAKIEGADSRQVKVVFQSEVSGSYQGQNIWISNEWKRYSHTFTVENSSDQNSVRFWFMQDGVTFFLDEVSVSPGKRILFDQEEKYQSVDGFGAGIKRRTEQLYSLNDSFRQQIEEYCFQDLEVNMIRFFVYHDLEPENDNNDPYNLDESQLDWTRYDSEPGNWRTRYVGEALLNAFDLSINGFDHVIGNCNSAPPWLKTNGQHNGGGTLIPGEEAEFSEFLIAFINGMQTRYGVNVTAISPTNEPDYEVSYESMNTTPSELSSILTNLDARLSNMGLNDIKIVSPECFRVESQNSNTSATNYINAMFQNEAVENAVDVVGTHTYADPNHNANWSLLKEGANNKPVWVTESASLHSTDQSMTDAANYIKWILRGFNEGGMTGYMMHLFYEQVDNDGYSSLVAWTPVGEIILPKRYFTFKHFSNLVKKDYRVIKNNSQALQDNIFVGAFIAPDESKLVLQVFNQGLEIDLSIDIPKEATSMTRILTDNGIQNEFAMVEQTSLNYYDRYFTANLPEMSLTSFVFDLDGTLSNEQITINENQTPLFELFPNPSESNTNLKFEETGNYNIIVLDLNGKSVIEINLEQVSEHSLNISSLNNGVYFVKVSNQNNLVSTKKLIKK